MIRKFMLCLVFFLIAFGSFYSVIRSLNIIIQPEIRDATLAELDGDEAFEARYSIWDGYDNTQVHDDLFRQTDFYADILSARYTAIPTAGDATADPQEMALVSFLRYFSIDKETAEETAWQMQESFAATNSFNQYTELGEVPDIDLLYTFDNEKINAYYRYDS